MPPRNQHGNRLAWALFGSIVLAVGFALAAPRAAAGCELGGTIFLNLLKMLVVPLVVCSVMCGILGLGDLRKLGRPAAATFGYYLTTTLLAVVLGLVLVGLIRPGQGIAAVEPPATESSVKNQVCDYLARETGAPRDEIDALFGQTPQPSPDVGRMFRNLVESLFPDNLVRAALDMNLLGLIVFSILFASVLTMMPQADALRSLIEQANATIMTLVMVLMKIAPIGVFCLVASCFGQANAEGRLADLAQKTGWYVATVLVGLAIHGLVVLPAILYLFTRRNPWRFILQMSEALLTAFSTASSTATLPVTMRCAEENAGVSRRSVEFVLPLGATINMDGTALYEAVAAIFIAQAIGMEMTLTQQITIALTATLASIGAAGIPHAGLVTMLIVLAAVGIPAEHISLIVGVDWFLDRFRTAVNCFGDACGAAVVEKTLIRSE